MRSMIEVGRNGWPGPDAGIGTFETRRYGAIGV